jgi:hypothetical protein
MSEHAGERLACDDVGLQAGEVDLCRKGRPVGAPGRLGPLWGEKDTAHAEGSHHQRHQADRGTDWSKPFGGDANAGNRPMFNDFCPSTGHGAVGRQCNPRCGRLRRRRVT